VVGENHNNGNSIKYLINALLAVFDQKVCQRPEQVKQSK